MADSPSRYTLPTEDNPPANKTKTRRGRQRPAPYTVPPPRETPQTLPGTKLS